MQVAKQSIVKCLVIVFGLLTMSSAVQAEDKVALVPFKGPKSAPIELEVRTILEKKGYEVVSVDSVKSEGGAIATITGLVKKKRKRWSVVVAVFGGADGSLQGKTTFKARKVNKLRKALKAKLWKRVGSFVESGSLAENQPGTSEEDSQAAEKTATAVIRQQEVSNSGVSNKTVSIEHSGGLEASLSIGTQIINRRFNYKDDLRQSLATYDIDAMMAIAIEGEVYPIQQLGVAASYSYVPSFNSGLNNNSDQPFPTTHRAFLAGVRGRYKLGRISGRVDVDYGGQNFTIKGALASSTPIPNLRYRFVRAGAAMKVDFASFYTAISGGYRHILSSGEISADAYFPRLDAAGVDGKWIAGYELFSGWNVEVAATMERYFFTMNPEVGDSLIAGGAVDFYRGAQFSLRYHH